jgi:hypothetical protein
MLQRLFCTSAVAVICLIAAHTVQAHDSVVPHAHPHIEASGLPPAPALAVIALMVAGAVVLVATRVIRSPTLVPSSRQSY